MRSALSRRVNAAIVVLLVAVCFFDQPGRTTFDTKFDLTADPARFLGRALHLWSPDASLGELQNQAYGYLFPQGSWFALWHLVGLPDWIAQRLWSGLLLVVAFEGARRLTRVAGVRPWWAATVAGLTYALTPRLLSTAGTLTGEIVPTALLPWVVLPIALAGVGRLRPWTAGCLAGVGVLCMGGLNAVENLATFPLPVLVAAFSAPPVRRRLVAATLAGLALASLWWMLPLLLLGRYSPPFLDYIETAATTTAPLGFTNLMRGADHWLQFYAAGDRAWWPGGLALASEPVLIVVTALVAALGLAGLVRTTPIPLRTPLLLSAFLGLALMYVGHDPRGGVWGSPIAGPVRDLLDGPLAAFRNVHKVDPLVRLPLAIGLGSLAAVVARPETWARLHPSRRARVAHTAVGALVAVVLLGGLPLWTAQLRMPGYTSVPSDWTRAAQFLARDDRGGRALVVPGTGFGIQTWGVTMDEPLQGLATTPWVTRGQVPLAPSGTIRYLDALEQVVAAGARAPGLAAALARAGIDHVVLRRDLVAAESDAPPAAVVAATLDRSPGFRKVHTSGSVDVYQVDAAAPTVEAVTDAGVLRMAGAPDDVVRAVAAGAVAPGQPVLLRTGRDTAPVDVVSDQYQRRERQFGRVHQAVGNVLSAADPWVLDRRRHDYAGPDGVAPLVIDGGEVASVTASSSAARPDVLGPVHPELGPWSAVDGDPATLWRTAPFEDPQGAHLDVRLARQHVVSSVEVDTESDTGARRVTAVDITVGETRRRALVDSSTGRAIASFPGVPTTRVRVTIAGLADEGALVPEEVGVRDVRIGGVESRLSLVLPPVPLTSRGSFVFGAHPGRRACLTTQGGPVCDLFFGQPAESDAGLARTITVPRATTWQVDGTVSVRSTAAAAMLLEPVPGLQRQVRVRASSVYAGDPVVSGQRAIDGDPFSAWIADPFDQAPGLDLSWPGVRTLDRINVVSAGNGTRAPSTVKLRSGRQTRTVRVDASGLGFFEPLRTDHVELAFGDESGDGTNETGLPLGVAEVRISGLRSLTHRIDGNAPTGGICGFGPTIRVDGVAHRTRVTGQVSDVLTNAPMRLSLCGRPLRLTAGEHEIRVEPSAQFAAESLRLSPRAALPAEATKRSTSVLQWDDTHRRVRVGAGDAGLLRVPENANAGWIATLEGRTLTPQTVDGWQQGWRLPAGAGGVVTLRFAPDTAYHWALGIGGLAALAVVVGAALGLRRRAVVPIAAVGSRRPPGRLGAVLSGVAALVAFGPVPLLAMVGARLSAYVGVRRSNQYVRFVHFCVVSGVMLLTAAGVISAVLGEGSRAVNPFVADVCAGLALGLLMMGAVQERE